MYFLLKMEVFQPVRLVFRVVYPINTHYIRYIRIYGVYGGLSIKDPPSQHHFPYDAKGQQLGWKWLYHSLPKPKNKNWHVGVMFFVHKCLADELKGSSCQCVWKIHPVTYRKSFFFLGNGLDLGIIRQDNSIENMSCENENHLVLLEF